MFKGMCVCYAVIVSTYFSVGIISGYWASGNQAQPTILTNFMGDGRPLLPTVNQLLHSYAIGCYHSSTSLSLPPLAELHSVYTIWHRFLKIYLQPTNEVFEKWFAGPKMDQFSIRSVISRLIFRSLSVIIATFFAAMLPFFGDIMAHYLERSDAFSWISFCQWSYTMSVLSHQRKV